jgi:protein ImuA
MLPGLATPALHEFYADRGCSGAALCGLALASARQITADRSLLWVRQEMLDHEVGAPYPPGLDGYGLAPSGMILVRARGATVLLQAALEGARTRDLGAVVVELWGDGSAYDLTASRRLAFAAKASGTLVLLARLGASPVPSAAETRWLVRPAPSRALAAQAPGNPAFEMTLLRARNGQQGLRYHLEWDCDACKLVFRPLADTSDIPAPRAPLPGAVVPVSFDRPGAPSTRAWKQAG